MENPEFNRDFATTHWSMVLSSREGDSGIRRASLSQLCEAYWYPLFAYLRRKGFDSNNAADFVQGFFADLIDKEFLDAVSEEKGRFRWFLMTAIKRFVAKQLEKENAQKRGGGQQIISLDVDDAELKYQMEPSDGWSAEKLFDRRWALTVLEQALERLGNEQQSKGRGDLYQALKPTLGGEQMTGAQYAEIGDSLGMSANAVKVSALRLRQKYRESIRGIVSETVEDPARIDEEIESLFEALSQ